MPKFTIEHTCSHGADEAYSKIKEFLSNDQDIRRFDPKALCSFDDQSKSASLKGGQFKADIALTPAGAGSKVAITVDLPLMLSPFKGKITEMLKSKLSKYLG